MQAQTAGPERSADQSSPIVSASLPGLRTTPRYGKLTRQALPHRLSGIVGFSCIFDLESALRRGESHIHKFADLRPCADQNNQKITKHI